MQPFCRERELSRRLVSFVACPQPHPEALLPKSVGGLLVASKAQMIGTSTVK